jgi:hypothetical protein
MPAITEQTEIETETVTTVEGEDGVVQGNVEKFFNTENVSMMGGWTN